jgi:hypothetical protein
MNGYEFLWFLILSIPTLFFATKIPDLDLKLITHALLLSLIGSVTIIFPMITRKIRLKINKFNHV